MTLKTDLIILAVGTVVAILAPTIAVGLQAYHMGLIP